MTPTAADPFVAPFPIRTTLELLLAREDLSREEATEVMEAIIAGRIPPASIAAFAIALRAKGETVTELAAFAGVMRARCLPVQAPPGTLDTCGTGGDNSATFNISTATAFVVAGMGIPVAKHGGRSASSLTGSADVLKALGVNIDAGADCVGPCIERAGIGFLFAPVHHPGMKNVAPVRRELGVRTVFNLLGPLSNPARASFQVLGVSDPALCETFAEVLKTLGSRSAMIVCGRGTSPGGFLDEVSTFGTTRIGRLLDGKITVDTLDPASLGIAVAGPDSLHARGPEESAETIRKLFAGEKGAARDIVALNAAAAAIVAGKARDWKDGLRLAAESLDSGAARGALERLVAATNGK